MSTPDRCCDQHGEWCVTDAPSATPGAPPAPAAIDPELSDRARTAAATRTDGPPKGHTRIDLGMTNFDCSVDDGLAEELTQRPVFGSHAGWDFFGVVWWDELNAVFREQVWCYGTPVGTYSAATLHELMHVVNDAHGWG